MVHWLVNTPSLCIIFIHGSEAIQLTVLLLLLLLSTKALRGYYENLLAILGPCGWKKIRTESPNIFCSMEMCIRALSPGP